MGEVRATGHLSSVFLIFDPRVFGCFDTPDRAAEQEKNLPYRPVREKLWLTKPYISIQGFENRYKPFKTMALGRGFYQQQEKPKT